MTELRDGPRHAVICGCFALSGLAALVYQTAWTRQFALVFGTSELAVATVLAAHMAGLALGARCVEVVLPRLRRPLWLYATLELGIAIAALLLVPLCMRAAEALLVSLLGGQTDPPGAALSANSLVYLATAFATLLVPTALMGATLPLLARDGVHDERQIGSRVGSLYACNTAGAVLGALLGATVLLPQFGLRATVWVAAGVNLLVCGLACLLALLDAARESVDSRAVPPATADAARSGPAWILPLILLSGSVSFLQEVLWTRLLLRVVGSSIQSFGLMVASFLTGIAMGGALGARLASRRQSAAAAFVVSQLAVALALILGWYALLGWAAVPNSQFTRAAFGFAVLLPLSLAVGVTYPLAVRIRAGGVNDAAAASARVYGWNTAGAIVGALAAGFWLIPVLRFEGAMRLSVVLSLVLALLAAISLQRSDWWKVLPLALLATLAAVLFRPTMPESLLRVSPLRHASGTIVHYGVGRSADVVVVRDDVNLDLRTNGLPEAGMPVRGAPPVANVEAWMSVLAVLARPDTENMLIVGFGGGNVVQAVPPSVRRVDVIELEPRVIEANRAIARLRLQDPLADARLNIIINDARGALELTKRRYDAIVSQPSHPWTAGASHLYTREFVQLAHTHLAAGGVFVQWLGAEYADPALLRSVVATLLDVFAEVRVYRPTRTTVLLVASDLPVDIEHRPVALRATLARAPLHYGRLGLNGPEDLVAALALETADARQFAADTPPITDDRNRLATANIYARGMGMSAEQVAALLAPYDPLTRADSFVYRGIVRDLSFEYLWRRVVLWAGASNAAVQRMNRVADLLGDTDVSQLLRYMSAMQLRQPAYGTQLLHEGLQRWPDSTPLLYAADARQFTAASGVQRPQSAATFRLPAEPAMVLKAMRAAADEDWGSVAEADARLATVPWTAQWGLQAARLRTEWRVHMTDPALRQRLGEEGIAIADRAEVSQPDATWHALRAWSAAGTLRPEVILESTAKFCAAAEAAHEAVAGSERYRVSGQAAGLLQLLQTLDGDTRVDAGRVQAVQARLRKIIVLLQ